MRFIYVAAAVGMAIAVLLIAPVVLMGGRLLTLTPPVTFVA